MRNRMLLTLLLVTTVPIWAQVDSQPANEGNATSGSVMIAPPPVSGQVYPEEVGAEIQSNYLKGGLSVGGGYIRNLFVGGTSALANETSLSIRPNISLDEATPRQHLNLEYSPQFNFYRPTSTLNETDHSLDATYRLRVMPHIIVSASNNFQKSAVVFFSPAFNGGVSPSPPPAAAGAIPPLAHWTGNTVQGILNWQYARSAMVGGSGILAMTRFADSSQVTGLFNSDSRGGSGFWTRQVSASEYLGAVYQYFDILADPSKPLSETYTHTLYAFYTRYLTDLFSVSVSAGPQHFQVDQPSAQSVQAWAPAVIASLAWQRKHTNFSLGYGRTVTGGGGLLGAYHSNSANMSARWQIARTWTTSVMGSYASNRSVFKEATKTSPFFNTNGHSIFGSLAIDHYLTEHIVLEGEYDRIHQSYGTIAAIASVPNSDRITVSLAWRFTHPLGR